MGHFAKSDRYTQRNLLKPSPFFRWNVFQLARLAA